MKNCLLVVFCSIALTFNSCVNTIIGQGPITNQDREVESFNKIACNANVNLVIQTGSSQKLKIKAQQNIIDVLVTRVDGKTLVITTKGNIEVDEPVVIETAMINPEAFEMNGSGELKSSGTLASEMLDLEVNGSGLIDLDLQVNKLNSSVSGSGRLALRGNADDFKLQINGSGEVNATEMICQTAKAIINGSGEAKINVISQLKSTINGSGTISYKGSPKISSDINGSGSIVRAHNQ
jgi:hypothetical protein